jgi:glutathione peroxidase
MADGASATKTTSPLIRYYTMKRFFILAMLTSVASWLISCIGGNKPTQPETETNLYNIHYTTIEGADATLAAFKGKKILIVNVASQCGNTPQYEGLEALYKKYGNKLVIVGFPCNQFFGQEPGCRKRNKIVLRKKLWRDLSLGCQN